MKNLTLEERQVIEDLLQKQKSKREIARKLTRSHSTILDEIKRNKGVFGLYNAIEAHKSKMKKPQRQHISLRHDDATYRLEPGHFEVDLMIFSKTKTVLAVFVDRCTRKTWAYINSDKKASTMADTMREFVCDAGIMNVKSLSFDNGTENFYHHIVRDEFGTFDTFFCDPYCSWQKGTVENTNKLLRQYFPRSIEPHHNLLKIVLLKLNNRPRKCLNFLTPNFCSF